MQAALEFPRERIRDGAVTGHPRQSSEFRRRDSDTKMRFPLGPGACMSGMFVAVVDHFECNW